MNSDRSAAAVGTPKLTHSIVDNSALSVVTTPDGNRHLFFQEVDGTIRQAFYNGSTQSWLVSRALVISSNARNNTPIASILLPTTLGMSVN